MSHPSADDRPRTPWLPLAAAGLLVPTVLAGLTLLWPGPQIEDGLARAAGESLATAGFTDATARLDGRDALVSGISTPDAQRAVGIVQGVNGVRVASARPSTDPAGSVAPPAAGVGADGGEPDPAARRELDAAIDALLDATPITFEPNSPALTAQGAATVARMLELVAGAPGLHLQVDGFVAAGPGDGLLTAQELSDARAVRVRDTLAAGGIPVDHLTVRGLGEGREPVPDAAGRRVDITVR